MAYNRFNDQIYSKSNITVSEIISNKNLLVHQKLYDDALAKYKNVSGKTDDLYKFIEIKGSYFDSPSSVVVTERKAPFRKYKVSLEEYWGEYKFYENSSEMKIDEYSLGTSEIIYKDYVAGTALLRSKINGDRFQVPLSSVDDTWQNAECMDLTNKTFRYKIDKNMKV